MRTITHTIDAPHVDAFRGALLAVYDIKTRALHTDLIAPESLDQVDFAARREEIAQVAELLDQLDWRPDPDPHAIQVTSRQDLIAHGYRAALDHQIQQLLRNAASHAWPLDDLPHVRNAIARSSALIDQLTALQPPAQRIDISPLIS